MAVELEHVRDLIATHLPQYRDIEITRLGTGLDNVSYLVGGELVIRVRSADDIGSGDADPQSEVGIEAAVLAVVARHVSPAVPEPLVAADGMLVYRMLGGSPLITALPVPSSDRVGHALGRLLAELHAIPVAELPPGVHLDEDPLEEWLGEAQECFATSRETIPDHHRLRILQFLKSPVPPEPTESVFGHNDLGAEHVLIDPRSGTVTGVIDWSDAGFADPAIDLGLILRDLGPTGYAAAQSHITVADSAALQVRALFYARCRALEDVLFGREQGRSEYISNAVRAMQWLFPDGLPHSGSSCGRQI